MTTEKQHAVLGPSSASRWLACPASVIMSQLAGIKDTPSDYANEGTAAHELAHRALTNAPHLCEDYLGHRINGWEVDEGMCRDTQLYVDSILELSKGHALFVEQAVPIGHLTGEYDAVGTADAIIIPESGEWLQIVDLKFGRGIPVKAADNKQLMLYALGALEKFQTICWPQTVKLTIHQPRIDPVPYTWEIDIEDLMSFEQAVRNTAAKFKMTTVDGETVVTARGPMPPVPGETQCRFCKVAGVCPALTREVSNTVAGVGDAEIVTLLDPCSASVTEIGTRTHALPMLTNAELALLRSRVELVEIWARAVKSTVHDRLARGQQIPGYKLIEGRRGIRAWTDSREAEAVMKAMRLKVDDMYNKKLISPTQAEKTLAKTKTRNWAKLQGLIIRKDGAPVVAEAGHSSPALVFDPNADLAGLLEEPTGEDLS